MTITVMLAIVGVFVAAAAPLQHSCGVTTASVRRRNGTIESSATEYFGGEHSVVCNHDIGCNMSNPATGLACWPFRRQCAMCGDPTSSMIGANYTLVIRPNCNSVEQCEGNATFTKTIEISHIPAIHIESNASIVYAKTCPLFRFVGLQSITISNLVVQCESTTMATIAPVILIEKSATLGLFLDNVRGMGYVRSTILMIGGNYDATVPVTSTSLSGHAAGVSVAHDSVYIDAQALTLTQYTGTLDVSNLTNFTRVLVIPHSGGYLDTGTNDRIDITNESAITNILDTPYEAEFDSGNKLYGVTAEDKDAIGHATVTYGFYALIFLVVFPLVMHQDIFYLRHVS